ncbi:hypothetical protein E1212_08590 [Jiangella ureilytica]|uniref:Uncharacterized protein n=1 Tax=Jiangella ureilytica TaxID=2530374 RepID=A0A4R4RSN8_9ACTN|nr:hypothetical protein [Jiangella ureilytica]TDC52634.1 hypothetical protein E1212_08590 [Jiangella ureilytica]
MTMGDGSDDAPFDLGVVGPAGGRGVIGVDGHDGDQHAGDGARGSSHAWRRWALLAAGLAAGGLLGAVIVDARHDAAELADVAIISGPANWMLDEGGSAAASVDLQLVNIGSRPVEILGIAADGFEITPDAEPFEQVEAPVGEWVVVQQTGLVADCSANDAPDAVQVRIRDAEGDERTVDADQNSDYGSIGMLWTDQCEFNAGYVQFVGPVIATTVGESSLTVTLPLLNYSGRSVQITRLVPMAPGLAATQPELPIRLVGHATAQIELTWTVEDCAAATSMAGDDGMIEFTVTSGSREVPEFSPLDTSTMVELVRLAGRVCG